MNQVSRRVAAILLIGAIITLFTSFSQANQETPQQAAPEQLSFTPPQGVPGNISGTYTGFWYSNSISLSLRPTFSDHGPAIYRMSSFALPNLPNVHFLSGETLFRDPQAGLSQDLRLYFDGVYALESGNALMFSNTPDWISLPEVAGILHADLFNSSQLLAELNTSSHIHRIDRFLNGSAQDPLDHVKEYYSQESARFSMQLSLGGAYSSDDLSDTDPNSVLFRRSPHLPIHIYSAVHLSSSSFNASSIVQELRYELYLSRASKYALACTVLSILHIFALVRQAEYSSPQARASRLSIVSIAMQALLDSYLSLFHLTIAVVVEPLFASFMLAALVQFMVFSLFEMRLLLVAWKSRRQDLLQQGWDTIRSELGTLYMRFYATLLVGLCLLFLFQELLKYFVLILYSFWIPQIIHNVSTCSRKSLQTPFVIIVSLLRLFPPLYFSGCPHNFISFPNDYAFCYLLCMYVAAQAALLLLQDARGPRFFVPVSLLPPKYNYWRATEVSPEEVCTICLLQIFDCEQGSVPGDVMLCPCNHAFHESCLQRWMDQKMECPTCRGALPPM